MNTTRLRDPSPSLPLTVARQLDDVCARFEAAWQTDTRPDLADFLTDAPELARTPLLLELIKIDVHYRRRAGDAPTVGEYQRRFPAMDADRLAEAAETVPAGTPAPTPDTRLGDFRIIREVGRGGMGVVYEAEQISLGRRVALKVASVPPTADRARRRFHHEAHAVAALTHPHIIPVYATGADGGVLFLAMRFVEGRSLAAVLASLRTPSADIPAPLPRPATADYYRAAARLAATAADALQHAHDLGIVHRDIKPGNLLLEANGHLWVADFGLARLPGADDLTRTGEVLGTLRYMSPEQARGAAVDHRADVYSLGVTLYELLTLRPAFPGTDPGEVIRAITDTDPKPPRDLAPSVPPDLQTIALKAMAKDPAERYSTARHLADDLNRFLDDRPILARPPTPAQRVNKWAKRNRRLVGLVVAAAFCVLTATAVVSLVAADQVTKEKGLTEQANGRLTDTNGELVTANARLLAADERKDRALYTANFLVARKAWLDGDMDAAERFLDLCPDAHRGWEWHYLRPRCRNATRVYTHDNLNDLSLGIAPDGSVFANTQVADDILRFYRPHPLNDPRPPDVLTVRLREQGLKHPNSNSTVFSPDGKQLFAVVRTATHEGVVWDTTTGEVLLRLPLPIRPPPHGPAVHLFGPNGLEAATHHDGKLTLWDVPGDRARLVVHFPEQPTAVTYVDGLRRLVIESPGRVEVRDATTGRVMAGRIRPAEATAGKPLLSPNGLHSAATSGSEVQVREVVSGKVIRTLRGNPGRIHSMAFSPDGGRLATGDNQRVVIVWDLTTGEPLATVRHNSVGANHLAFGTDGRTLTCGCVLETRAWDTLKLQEREWIDFGAQAVISRAVFPDGQHALVQANSEGGGTELRHVSLADGATLRVLAAGKQVSTCGQVLSADGRFAAARCLDNHIQVWDVRTWEVVRQIEYPARRSRPRLALSADGGRLAYSDGQTFTAVVDLPSGRELRRLPAVTSGSSVDLSLSPTGEYAAAVHEDENVMTLWPVGGGDPVPLRGHTGKVQGVAFHPTRPRVTTASWDGTLRTWELPTGRPLSVVTAHPGFTTCVAYHPDGSRLAAAALDGTVSLFHADSGERYLSFRDANSILRVQFFDQGQQLWGFDNSDNVRVWRSDVTDATRLDPKRETQLWYGAEARRLSLAKWPISSAWFRERATTAESPAGERWAYGYSLRGAEQVDRGRLDLILPSFERSLSPADMTALYQFAPRLIVAGDADGYERLCAKAEQTFSPEAKLIWPPVTPAVLVDGFRLRCLGPRKADAAAKLVEQVQTWLKDARDRGVYDHVLGMALYRAGKPREAVASLEIADRAMKTTDGMQAVNWLFLAMACHADGRSADAAKWLAKADEWYAAECKRGLPADGKLPIEDRAAAIIPLLRAEAVRVVGGK